MILRILIIIFGLFRSFRKKLQNDFNGMETIIRKAVAADVGAVAVIYGKIHALEKAGVVSIGWDPEVYPVRDTALGALEVGALFVMVLDGRVVASAIINQEQPSAYASVDWLYPATDDRVGVLHTLVVDPDFGKRGLGKRFVSFFESYCRELRYEVVRLDTQTKNIGPFNMYPKLGYRLSGIRTTKFQELPDTVELAMFEKKLSKVF